MTSLLAWLSRSDARLAAAVGVLSLFVLALAAWLEPAFNYNRWDNYELFTPLLTHAHELWLRGEMPVWNPHQYLGEPILRAGQPAPFYPGYTLAVLLVKGLGLPPGALMAVVAVLHVPFAGAGFTLLGRALGQERSIAVLLALSASFGGYVTAISTVWMWMLPVFAWLPWILWGALTVLSGASRWRGALALASGLAIEATLGRPPILVSLWIFVVLFAGVFGLWVHRTPRRTAEVFLLFGVAMLLSGPPLLPMIETIGVSERGAAFPLAQFLSRSVPPQALLGWLHPLLGFEARFLPDPTTRLLYQGGWIVPALVGGIVAIVRTRREVDSRARRAFLAMLGLAAGFTVLALGEHTAVYAWTHGLPIWSSFQWPFRILLLSQPAVAMAAALGAGLWIRSRHPSALVGISLGALVWLPSSVLLAFAPAPGFDSAIGVVCVLTAVASMALLPWAAQPWARGALVAVALANSVGVVALSHRPGWKDYPEPWASVGPALLGISTGARVLPVVSGPDPALRAGRLQHLALFHAATGNGYDSATGTGGGLTPQLYQEFLEPRFGGAVLLDVLEPLLGSHLLASFHVGYFLVSSADRAALERLEDSPHLEVVRRLPEVVVFRSAESLPRAYFATHAFPDAADALRRGLVGNEAPLRSAYVHPAWEGPRELPVARVLDAEWATSEFSFSVDAPEGGLLVASVSWSPDWTARVDGARAEVVRVNRRILGVSVPPGGRHVTIHYHSRALGVGAASFAVGCVALLAYGRARRG